MPLHCNDMTQSCPASPAPRGKKLTPTSCGKSPGLRGLPFWPNPSRPVPPRLVPPQNAPFWLFRDFCCFKRRLSGQSRVFVPSESVVLKSPEFFIGQRAAFWVFASFLSAAKRPSGQSGALFWLETVRLPKQKSFFGWKASFWLIRNFLLLKQRRFAR